MPSCLGEGWQLFFKQSLWNLENQFEIRSGTCFPKNSKYCLSASLGSRPRGRGAVPVRRGLTRECGPVVRVHLPALLHDVDDLPRAELYDVLHVWPVPRLDAQYQLLLTDGVYRANGKES